MNRIEQASKAGIASALARQSPGLIADKSKAIELHQAGHDTGAIGRALNRQRTEIRRWLIAAGVYRTLGRGKAVKGRKRYDATRLIAAQYATEFRQIAKTDDCAHWQRQQRSAIQWITIMLTLIKRERADVKPQNCVTQIKASI